MVRPLRRWLLPGDSTFQSSGGHEMPGMTAIQLLRERESPGPRRMALGHSELVRCSYDRHSSFLRLPVRLAEGHGRPLTELSKESRWLWPAACDRRKVSALD